METYLSSVLLAFLVVVLAIPLVKLMAGCIGQVLGCLLVVVLLGAIFFLCIISGVFTEIIWILIRLPAS